MPGRVRLGLEIVGAKELMKSRFTSCLGGCASGARGRVLVLIFGHGPWVGFDSSRQANRLRKAVGFYAQNAVIEGAASLHRLGRSLLPSLSHGSGSSSHSRGLFSGWASSCFDSLGLHCVATKDCLKHSRPRLILRWTERLTPSRWLHS